RTFERIFPTSHDRWRTANRRRVSPAPASGALARAYFLHFSARRRPGRNTSLYLLPRCNGAGVGAVLLLSGRDGHVDDGRVSPSVCALHVQGPSGAALFSSAFWRCLIPRIRLEMVFAAPPAPLVYRHGA